MGRRNRPAMRALRARSWIRNRASYAEGKPGCGALLLTHDVGNQEHQFLGPDPDPVSISKDPAVDQWLTVELRTVSAVQVFEYRLRSGEVDPNVAPGQHGVFDRNLAHRSATDHHLITEQVDLL